MIEISESELLTWANVIARAANNGQGQTIYDIRLSFQTALNKWHPKENLTPKGEYYWRLFRAALMLLTLKIPRDYPILTKEYVKLREGYLAEVNVCITYINGLSD